ncbi:unnamed protein product [Amoebophrya sp. A120]|nr:unnamed protein product [Amoebophrya sp. A120]|eukprot:GSA120T00007268001.1
MRVALLGVLKQSIARAAYFESATGARTHFESAHRHDLARALLSCAMKERCLLVLEVYIFTGRVLELLFTCSLCYCAFSQTPLWDFIFASKKSRRRLRFHSVSRPVLLFASEKQFLRPR